MDHRTAQENKGYGKTWKKWLTIYVALGAVAYLIVFFVFLPPRRGRRLLTL